MIIKEYYMKHENCIFLEEDLCPREEIELTCEKCLENKAYEVIEKAVRDFSGSGEAFQEIFDIFKQLMDNDGSSITIKTPVDSIFLINRFITAMLGTSIEISENEKLYRRIIFYLLRNLIDEFESEEYKKTTFIN